MHRPVWMLAAWLAISLMSAAPAPAQSPETVAAAKDLMAVMRSSDNFKAMFSGGLSVNVK